MKSLFPYFVMIVLFLAGTRLVNRQQTYIRSIQESATADTTSFTSLLEASEVQPQATADTGLMNSKKRLNSLIR